MRRKKMMMVILAAILIVTVGILSGCGDKETSSDETTTSSVKKIESLDTTDINGKPVDMSIFKDKKLTLVNLFSTNCGPCMGELPDIADLSKELEGSDMSAVAVILNTTASGKPDMQAGGIVKGLLDDKADFLTVIYPDENMQANIISDVTSVPYTFFVDENGEMVGEPYIGAHSKDEWKDIMNKLRKTL